MSKDKPNAPAGGSKHKFWLDPPLITAMNDQPLPEDAHEQDGFRLAYRMGPVYDIIRHPRTRPPLAVAVYGSWGAGKTTAMRWLQGLLEDWTKSGNPTTGLDKVKIRCIWFDPWKYQTKEEVWRGLIAEVILACIDVEDASVTTVVNAARRFGVFLGKSFVHVLASMKLKARTPAAAGLQGEAELSLSAIKDILSEYREAARPEEPYLNDFEAALKDWVKQSLADDERLVIFVDDLDRCMPGVALQVLEALKLYLAIDRVVFVVGVDRDVINDLVRKHYEGLGLKEERSRKYLDKMFQVEVTVGPSEAQIGEYQKELLESGESAWRHNLSGADRDALDSVVLSLADRNPREIKRLINSAVMSGAGAVMGGAALDSTSKRRGYRQQERFAQGVAMFLIRRVLDRDYPHHARMIGSTSGDSFFREWSKVVRTRLKPGDDPCLRVPGVLRQHLLNQRGEIRPLGRRRWTEEVGPEDSPHAKFLQDAPPVFRELLGKSEWARYVELLEDSLLGDLMSIEYPADTAAFASPSPPPVGDNSNEQIIRRAVAHHLNKQVDDVTTGDLARCTHLDLSGTDLSSVEPLKGLTALKSLQLSETNVSNVEPLKALTALEELYLTGTGVSNVEPLKGLTGLAWLSLSGTNVSNVEPLKGLTALQELSLDLTGVYSVEPLKQLTALKWLYLTGTGVSNVEPLRGLTALDTLNLSRTNVSSVEPLKGLTALTSLYLVKTNVSSVEPLRGLTALTMLDLRGCNQLFRSEVAAFKRSHPLCKVLTGDLPTK